MARSCKPLIGVPGTLEMAVNLLSLGEQTNYYSFTAQSLAEALQRMLSLGPRDGDGHHSAGCDIRADIFPGLQTGIVPGSTVEIPNMGWTATAHISQGTLRYGFVFRFPNWSNIGSLSRPIQAEWRRYTRCLWVHERGHVQVTMQVLRRFLQQFQNLRIAGMGQSGQAAENTAQSELQIQVREVYNLLAHENQRDSNRYDVRTRHGRTQGARLQTIIRVGSRH
jgi:hypothetical protein